MGAKNITEVLNGVLASARFTEQATKELNEYLQKRIYEAHNALYQASEKYDYRKAIKDDIREYLDDNDIKVTADNIDDLRERLSDELFVTDSVTGNASGSYTFNTWKAEEYLCHNFDLLGEALQEFGCSNDYILEKGAEACDVSIRCYLLPECLDEVLNELQDEAEEENED